MKDPKAEAGRWIEQARRDLEAAEWIADGGRWWVACFLAQQAAEKAVKALLYASGERLVLGHTVAELFKRAVAVYPELGELKESSARLDRYYVPTRYPNGLPGGIPADSYAQQDAREALELAAKIVVLAHDKLQAS